METLLTFMAALATYVLQSTQLITSHEGIMQSLHQAKLFKPPQLNLVSVALRLKSDSSSTPPWMGC